MGRTRWKFQPELKLTEVKALDLICPRCGYNLRGLEAGNCPECGLAFTLEALRESQIPWTRREQIGWVRAFWLTVVMDQRRLAYEMTRRQKMVDARLFQFAVLAHVAVYCAVLAVAWGTLAPLSVLVFLLAVSAHSTLASVMVARRGFSEHRYRRAVAISMYGCSMLAWLGLPAIMMLLGAVGENSLLCAWGDAIGWIVAPIIVLGWLSQTSQLIARVSLYNWLGWNAVAVGLFFMFFMLVFVISSFAENFLG